MKVVLFGATGMIGQGVLRECLLAPDVTSVLAVGRAPTGQRHPKLRELVHRDFLDFSPAADQLTGQDACFFCLGVSVAGRSEADYRRVTVEYPVAAAQELARQSPGLAFCYLSGQGTDRTGQARSMWARVKGEAESLLLEQPGLAAYLFRPGIIQPRHGATSRTRSYRVMYAVAGPLLPLARRLFPDRVTTTELVGRAMLQVARQRGPERTLETRDINALAGAS